MYPAAPLFILSFWGYATEFSASWQHCIIPYDYRVVDRQPEQLRFCRCVDIMSYFKGVLI
jgi:hypothetical protein